jgi:hypothetical protein
MSDLANQLARFFNQSLERVAWPRNLFGVLPLCCNEVSKKKSVEDGE